MAEEAEKHVVHLDVAKSGRSTCRATGDKIEKGEHRVGIEAYTGGHISMTYQVKITVSRVTWCFAPEHRCFALVEAVNLSLALLMVAARHPRCTLPLR